MKGGAMFLLLTLFLLFPANAYDQHSTHPSLTYEMTQFFNAKNLNSNYSLLPNEVAWLKKGAIEEDEPARWINHFYDPVHNVGWSGKHLGDLSVEEGYKLGGDMAPRHSVASADWVTNQNYQAAYGRQYGNQTWQKAIKSYIDGDKKSAFIALGHVLHLVEDATVPDHVRDDSHPGIEGDPGSPYEVYSKVQTDAGELRTAEDLLKINKEFKKLQSINQAIKDVAVYTNANFFSEDTISNFDFQNPQLAALEQESKIVKGLTKNFLLKEGRFLAIYKDSGHNRVYSTDDFSFVLPSYRDHLFPEAVLTGASVINLFFQEVEKYKQNPNLLEQIVPDSNDSLLKAFEQFPKRTVLKACGLVGESFCKDVHNGLADAVIAVKNTAQTIASSVSNTVASLLNSNKVVVGNNEPAAVVTAPAPDVQIVVLNTSTKQNTVVKPTVKNTKPEPVNKIITKNLSADKPPVLGLKIINPPPKENTSSVVLAKPLQVVYGGGVQGNSVSENRNSRVPDQPAPPPQNTSSTISTSTSGANTSSTPPQIVPSTTPVIIDSVAPAVPIVHTANFSGVSSTNISINIESQDDLSGVASFDVQYSSNTIGWFDLVINSVPTHPQVIRAGIANLEQIFFGTRGQSYYFKARASDVAGNTSGWSAAVEPVFSNWSGEVVINEIAWAGTSADAPTQEWFELYNNTDQNIDLSNWGIFVSGRQINLSKINNKIINAKSYYLFERTSDNTVIEIGADAIYSLSGGFNNSGEKIELIKPNGEKADEVNASGGWFAGGGAQYKTMERASSTVNGSQLSNWQSNQGLRETGRTFNGGPIYGSPKRSNFGFINLIYDQVDTVLTLTKANNPYILQYYIIPAGKKLIIEPGVVIKSYFFDSRIDILGTLSASGSSSEKIIFTSGRDTSVDNNLIGSWPNLSASFRDWQGLWFKPGADGVLSNINFSFAGKGFVVPPFALPVSQAVRIDNADVVISDSIFSDNGQTALFSKDASTTIVRSQFSRGDRALESESSTLHISDSTFDSFTNSRGPLFIKDKWPLLQNISYQNNTPNMPYLEGVNIVNQTAIMSESENYLVHALKVSSTGVLYIQPDVSVFMPVFGIIEVGGSLQALGTAQKPINFLPYPASVNWGNIRFNKSTSTLNFVHLRQGNRPDGRPESLNGMILANDSHLTISNSTLWDSEATSIQSTNSVITIANSTIGATVKSNNMRGLKTFNGSIKLDAVSFTNLAFGLDAGASDLSALIVDIKNMASSSFNNVDYFWQPFNLWSFPLPLFELF